MAIGLRRKVRLDSRRDNQKITRHDNSALKRKERARRDARMAALARATPEGAAYAPAVASWLSQQLGVRSRCLTRSEVTALLG